MTQSTEQQPLDPAGQVKPPTVDGLPVGYLYGVTRYADVILERAFADRFRELRSALESFDPTLDELIAGGGNQTPFVQRFDESLNTLHDGRAWGSRMITVDKRIGFHGDTRQVSKGRSHLIDMFGVGSLSEPFPGIAVEMEWNNKDPFFDRDLLRFQALHSEDAIAVGVIVTRGPDLQALIKEVIRNDRGLGPSKYGASTTHWGKLMQRMVLGGGGECPLLLVGIQPERIHGIERAYQSRDARAEAKRSKGRQLRVLRVEAYNLLFQRLRN
ncbi:MAG: BglII/BstYI family type II restriction endonuclease [bacterium]|nr:BglII/BstYI family type II restriction endonuclease [bacterium]MDE0235455.1 BglII/BstYI family type II restriction endonuclease [bacterium]